MREIVSDALGFVGIAAVVTGAWIVDMGAGIAAAGGAAIALSYRLGRDL